MLQTKYRYIHNCIHISISVIYRAILIVGSICTVFRGERLQSSIVCEQRFVANAYNRPTVTKKLTSVRPIITFTRKYKILYSFSRVFFLFFFCSYHISCSNLHFHCSGNATAKSCAHGLHVFPTSNITTHLQKRQLHILSLCLFLPFSPSLSPSPSLFRSRVEYRRVKCIQIMIAFCAFLRSY